MRCAVYVKEAPAPFTSEYQMERIRSILKNSWEITQEYRDKSDGREAFLRAVADGTDRHFDCILMESIFLFGESISQAEEVLCQILFDAGIHFAVADDGFFSEGKSKQDVVEYFEKKREESQTGANLRVVYNGKLSPRNCRYGYRLTDDMRGLVVDEETAAAVKEIFRLFLDGMKFAQIAKAMQERGVINPMDYKKKEIHHSLPAFPTAWVPKSVKNILMTELYTGTGTMKLREQAVLIHAEPLISREDFEKAQKQIGSIGKPKTVGYENNAFFKRVWFDGKQVVTREIDGELHFVTGKTSAPYSIVEAVVWRAILKEAADAKAALEKISGGCDEELARETAPLRERGWELFHAMEENATDTLNDAFSELTKQEILLKKIYSIQNEWIQKYRDMEPPKKLDFPFIQQWVKRIEVDENGGIHVLFHKAEWKKRLCWFKEG